MTENKYFEVDYKFGQSLINNISKNDSLVVIIHAYDYHSDTNHPTDLASKYYFQYSNSVEFLSDGGLRTYDDPTPKRIIAITPDYNTHREYMKK